MNNKENCNRDCSAGGKRKFFKRRCKTDPPEDSSVLSVDDLSISADENKLPIIMEKDRKDTSKVDPLRCVPSMTRQPIFPTTLQYSKHSTQKNLEVKRAENNKCVGFGVTSTPLHSRVPLKHKFIDEQLSPIVQEPNNAQRKLYSRIPLPQNKMSHHFIGETVSQTRKPLSPMLEQNKRATNSLKTIRKSSKFESCVVQISNTQHTSVVCDSNKVLEIQTCQEKITYQGQCYSRGQLKSNDPNSVPFEEVLSQDKNPITRRVSSNIEVHAPKKTNCDTNTRSSALKIFLEKKPQISKSVETQLHSEACIQQGTKLLNGRKSTIQKLEKANSKFEQVTDNKLNYQQLSNVISVSTKKSQQLADDKSKSILKKSVIKFDICEDDDDDDDIFGVSKFTKHKISSISGTTGDGDNKDLDTVNQKELQNVDQNYATGYSSRNDEKQNIGNNETITIRRKAPIKESCAIEDKHVNKSFKSFRGKRKIESKKVSFMEDDDKNQEASNSNIDKDMVKTTNKGAISKVKNLKESKSNTVKVINSGNLMQQNIDSAALIAACPSSSKVTKTITKPRARTKIIKVQVPNNLKSDFNKEFDENAQNTSSVNKFKDLNINKNTGNDPSNYKLPAEERITSEEENLDKVAVNVNDFNELKQDIPNKVNVHKSAVKLKEIEPTDSVKETIEYVVAHFEYSDETKIHSLPVKKPKLLTENKVVKRRLQEDKLELSPKRMKKEESIIQAERKPKVLGVKDAETNCAGSSQESRRSGRKRTNVKEYWIDSSNSEKSNEPEKSTSGKLSKKRSSMAANKIPSRTKQSGSLVQMPQGYCVDKMPCFSSSSSQFKVIQPGVGKATGIIVNEISTGGHICIQRDETFHHVSSNNIMYMVQKGSALVEINKTSKAVELNSFFFVPCHVPYKVKNQGRGRVILCFVKTLSK